MSNFYLAARFSRRFELQGCRADLLRIGHEVTSRWIDGGDNEQDCAARDACDIEIADGLIAFTELPRSTTSRGGRHVEFGLGVAMGKRLLVVGHRENVFYNLPAVEFFEDWSEALAALTTRERISLRDVWAPHNQINRRLVSGAALQS